MKRHILKTSNWFYGLIISLIGFSQGCSSNRDFPVMYGPPPPRQEGDYIVSGKVVNPSGEPIKNIKVSFSPLTYGVEYDIETDYTDNNGAYEIKRMEPAADINYTINFQDIDGDENGGEFIGKVENVTFKINDFTGGDGNLNDGKAEKTVNVTLHKTTE